MKIRVVFPGFREFLGIFMNCKSLIISDLGKEKRLTFQSGVKFFGSGYVKNLKTPLRFLCYSPYELGKTLSVVLPKTPI
jgi:hypothetical protein